MAEISPFCALYYSPEKVKDISLVVTPPYDVISPEERLKFYIRHPLNVIRLILPNSPLEARETLKQWLSQGVFEREHHEAIYPYRQVFSYEGRKLKRWGFICLLKLDTIIREHEHTFEEVVRERLELLEHTGIQTGEVFSLYSDPKGEIEALLSKVEALEPRFSFKDEEGVEHTLWAVYDQEEISKIKGKLSDQELFLADGHHRLKTARLLRERRLASGKNRGLEDYILAYLTGMEYEGLVILPVHRLLKGLDGTRLEALRKNLMENFSCQETSKEAIPTILMEGKGMVFWEKDRNPLMIRPKRDLPYPFGRIDPWVIDELVLKGLQGEVSYVKETDEALKALEDGVAQAVFLLRAVNPREVAEVAKRGLLMPKKSTYFYPKVPTGLVFFQVFELDGDNP